MPFTCLFTLADILIRFAGVGLVLLMYDHLLTFKEEVRLVWHAKPSVANFVFLLNRYLVLALQIGVACCASLIPLKTTEY